MTFSTAERNSYRAELIVDELIRNGVLFFSVAPGSRSSLLACALATRSEITLRIHPDERGVAFCALGHARGTGSPAGVVTTSGTAVANLYPAVIEAAMDRIPLLLLTADRPPDLRFLGGNQTIDQRQIFGRYVRWNDEIVSDEPTRIRHAIHYATYRSLRSPAGPVHLNIPFAEPLEPVDTTAIREAVPDSVTTGNAERINHAPLLELSGSAGEKILDSVRSATRGVIVAGRLAQMEDRQAVIRMVQQLGWPLLADPLSGLRYPDDKTPRCDRYDLILTHERFAESMTVDTVLHCGGLPTSKRLQKWLARCRPKAFLQVVDHPMALDPDLIVTDRIGGTPEVVRRFLASETGTAGSVATDGSWKKLNDAVESVLEHHCREDAPLHEPGVVRALSRSLASDHGLFVASSLPIRLIDGYSHADAHTTQVAANRGASGIDGTLASAVGYAHAIGKPVTLLIGDLALLHDLSSLLLLRETPHPISIVILNNNGGGIFHFLPIAGSTPHFERLFATPHGRTFEHAARMFELPYVRVAGTIEQFAQAYEQAVRENRSSIMEVCTERDDTHRIVQEIQSAVQAIPYP